MKTQIHLYIFVCIISIFRSQTNQYYFGNLHAHTGFSDGNKDSSVSGVSRPDGSYAYAKLSQHFDFLGISEHNHYSTAKNPGFKKQNYQVGINMANAANQNGTFAAMFGMEYGVSSAYNGHVIVYGFNQLIGWEATAPGVSGNNYDIYNSKSDYAGLFTKVKNNPNAFAYLAHPGFSDYATNTSSSTALAYGPYNAAFDSAIVGMPLRSGLAFSSAQNYLDHPLSDYFDYYKKMLYQGYHLGIGYDHDNHYTTFGRSNAGRLVLMAPSLSPNNIITAMQEMHFYASDDWNAKIDFNLNGHMMGTICKGGTFPIINVTHQDEDGELADSIKIWKGYKNSGGLWATRVHVSTQNNTTTFTDYDLISGIEYYYFAEIKQSDGDWIVTSPIWYNAQTPLKIDDSLLKIDFNFFPNPVSKNLSVSCKNFGDYQISIIDLIGRTVYHNQFKGQDFNIDLENVCAGVYNLKVENDKGYFIKKLIVE